MAISRRKWENKLKVLLLKKKEEKEKQMATSGTYTFNPDLADAMEEAFERAGRELDTITGQRGKLKSSYVEWQNRGLNL